jgi:cytochrome c551/c552
MLSNKFLLLFTAFLTTSVLAAATAGTWSWDKGMFPGDAQGYKAGNPASGLTIEARGLFRFPGDWDKIEPETIVAFYPGQTSWQWLTGDRHAGSYGLSAGQGCSDCHQARELGDALVEEGPLEPDPILGKEPLKYVQLKAAYDDKNFYIRFKWESERPGQTHDLWRFDGDKWDNFGAPRPDADRDNTLASYEDRLAMIIDDHGLKASDDSEATFAQAGCFITCHNSMREMPHEPSRDLVEAHPYLGQKGLGRQDIRKYLLITRTGQDPAGAWDKLKAQEELDNLFEQGKFLDLWQWRAARSNPVGYAGDDFVFEYRKSDAGKQPFKTPDAPEWMYDADKVGFNAIPETLFDENIEKFPLIIDETAVRLDPEAGFKEGDILSRRILREPVGSAGDILANGYYADGAWTVELKRALDTGNPDDKALKQGKIYNIGIAIFDDHTSNRRHYVSLKKTLGIGVDADITAQPIN